MSEDMTGLVASADRRSRIAMLVFAVVIGAAALFPHNDRAMWVPDSETPFVFTAVPEDKLPMTYLSIPGADTLLKILTGPGDDGNRSRFLPRQLTPDPVIAAPSGNIPGAAVPTFTPPTGPLANANTAPPEAITGGGPGGTSGPGSTTGGGGGGGGPGGGGPGTLIDPTQDPGNDPDPTDPIPDVPPVVSPVPEPVTWAMFIIGFGLIGWSLRRRKTGAALALAKT